MRLVVNTSAYVQASAELYSAQVFVRQALDGLGSGLAGAAQMAGNDDAGVKFAHDYDDAARNLIGGIADSLSGAGVLSRLLADTANVWADAEHYASGGVAPLGLASSSADTADLSGTCSVVSPTALGGRSDFVPEGWEWVQSVVGAVWPNGDTGKLRSAQKVWERAGDDLRSASWKVDAASSALEGLVTPELGLVQAKLDQYRGYLNDLSTSAYGLGQGCTSYADGIDEAHRAIIQELQELLVTTVAVEAGAALLAVFTVGASEVVGNAALMARIGLTGARVTAMIARLVEDAAAVGTRLAGITAAITRTLGLLRELKVVKVLTYLGTKAPAPVRAMTGISFNAAVSVGLDAAANGGTPANATHDILLGVAAPFGVGAAVNVFKTGTKAAIDAERVAAGLSVKVGTPVVVSAGGPGAWNRYLNKPRPNTTYVVDSKFAYRTDSRGRVVEASATLDTLGPGVRNKYQQAAAGRPDRLPTDDGGHIFGSQFLAPGEAINLTAMRNDLNRLGKREYYELEMSWAKAINEGKKVDVRVEIEYSEFGSLRPTGYHIEYRIGDEPTELQYFEN